MSLQLTFISNVMSKHDCGKSSRATAEDEEGVEDEKLLRFGRRKRRKRELLKGNVLFKDIRSPPLCL